MSIVIGCDSFLSLRNVRNGELGRRLAGEEVLVLVDPNQYEGSLQAQPEGVQIGRLLDFDPHDDPQLHRTVMEAYYTRKSYYDPTTFWVKLRASSYRGHPRPGFRRVASLTKARAMLAAHWFAGWLGLARPLRQKVARALRRHPVAGQYRELLRKWGAKVVVGFSPEGLREMVLIEAANSLGIPTAVMIRSRDNLAAKIQHLPDADAYFVWAEVTRRFLLHMYPEIPPERVHVTGSPQFDHHLNPAYRLPRKEFFQRIGLDPGRPLVVYTCATPTLIGHEIDIVQSLADAVRDGKLARGAQLLVRGHPRGFGSSHPLIHQIYPGVAVYPPPGQAAYNSPEHESVVVKLILEDEPMHLSTLAYQDVQVNVSGTMTVDSAIFDKPIVNIYYDVPARVPAGLSVRRFYRRTDYRSILESGGVRLAHSPEECIRLINQYLEDPAMDENGRRRIRETECGPLDGRAGERIAKLVRMLLPRVIEGRP